MESIKKICTDEYNKFSNNFKKNIKEISKQYFEKCNNLFNLYKKKSCLKNGLFGCKIRSSNYNENNENITTKMEILSNKYSTKNIDSYISQCKVNYETSIYEIPLPKNDEDKDRYRKDIYGFNNYKISELAIYLNEICSKYQELLNDIENEIINLLNQDEKEDGEYIYIEIIKSNEKKLIDFSLIQKFLSLQQLKSGLAEEIYDYLLSTYIPEINKLGFDINFIRYDEINEIRTMVTNIRKDSLEP